MCGIVAVLCKDNNSESLALESLERLEYRGYDSFGYFSENMDTPRKFVGAISKNKVHEAEINPSKLTIAHTRWATHGVVSERNSHPHTSMNRECTIVHNGVVSNYKEIKANLENQNYTFYSETDTEVIANLVEYIFYNQTKNPISVLNRLRLQLEGEFALCIHMKEYPNSIFALTKESPLHIGKSENKYMFASDEIALRGFCNVYSTIHNEDIHQILISENGNLESRVYSEHPNDLKDWRKLQAFESADVLKESESFFLKEMREIPKAISNSLSVDVSSLTDTHNSDIVLTGCGSAYYAAQIGSYLRVMNDRLIARTLAFPADEITNAYKTQNGDVMVCISQSGETYDTIAPAKKHDRVVSISNSEHSTLAKHSNHHIFQEIGPERCVLSTKSIVSQCVILHRAFLPHSTEIYELPKIWADVFDSNFLKSIESLAEVVKSDSIDNFFHVGRGIFSPIAYENALKLKEVTYTHAEGMAAGFFKHGTLSLIDSRFVVFAHLPSTDEKELYELTQANISEIKARDGRVYTIGHDDTCTFNLPNISKSVNPILHLGFGQYFAYYLATALGRDVDKPRFLAKSVTVR